MDGESRSPTGSNRDIVIYRKNPYAVPDAGSLENGLVVYRSNEDLCPTTDTNFQEYMYIDEAQLQDLGNSTSITTNDHYDDTAEQNPPSLSQQRDGQEAHQYDEIVKSKCTRKVICLGMMITMVVCTLAVSVSLAVISKNQEHKHKSQEPMQSTEESFQGAEITKQTTTSNLNATIGINGCLFARQNPHLGKCKKMAPERDN